MVGARQGPHKPSCCCCCCCCFRCPNRYISHPRHTPVLSGVVHRLLDTYAPVLHADQQVGASCQRLSSGRHQMRWCTV
jgi:hypothetical protein